MPILRPAAFLLVGLLLPGAGPAAARVFYVGADHQYKAPSEVAGLVAAGDEVEIEPGEYYDCAVWPTDRLTITGRGAGPVITDRQCRDKAAFIINGDDVVVRNITFTRIRVPDRNGAGIRHQGHDLTVENCRFINNEAGIISSASIDARITIRDSTFERNGFCQPGRCAASLDIPAVTVLRVERSRFTQSRGGSLIRSAAARTVLIDNKIGDAATAAPAALLLITGDLRAEGNVFDLGAEAEHPAIALRGLWHEPDLVLRRNSLQHHADQPGLLLDNMSSADPVLDDNVVAPGDMLVSNVGLLAARAKDVGHRGIAIGAHVTAPLRQGLQKLQRKLLPQ